MIGPHSEETKRKLSEIRRANPTRYWLGKSHSAETKRKIGAAKRLNPTKFWLGKKREINAEWSKKLCNNLKRWSKNEMSSEHRKKISVAHIGKPTWNKGKSNPHAAGSKNNNWKGGVTPLNKKIRGSLEYVIWRRQVFERDDYTCQSCGVRGGKLQADHELPFALFPDLRFELLNGRTLCMECHNRIGWHPIKNNYLALYTS